MSADRIVEIALSQVGYLEKKSNSNLDSFAANAGYANYTKYGAWYGINPGAWCDMFVSWCADQAGELAAVGKYAYVPSHVNFFKGKNQYFARGAKTPRKGDIIFFRDASHVGLVEYVSGGYVHTVEGNASGSTGLTPNGGAVVRKSYSLASTYVMGYGRPAYTGTDDTTKKEDYNVAKTYKNGSTSEPVYADTALSVKVGSLDPWESCDCLAIVDGRPLVCYKVDGKSSYKTGFVKYGGGLL